MSISRALVAEILSVDLDPYRQRLDLNRGLVDDVFVGQALIDAQGVVGQVVRVGPLTSEERKSLIQADVENVKRYGKGLDRVSAHERLQDRSTMFGQIKHSAKKVFPGLFGGKS